MDITEVLPEYVLQPHAISRSVYRLSATARKLVAMGMAILPPDLSSLTAVYSVVEFCQALGLDPSGKHYLLIQSAILETIKTPITLETAEEWKTFTWIQTASINKKTNQLTLEFSSGLAEYLLGLKKMYARIDLHDFGSLQSLYAIRFFELAKSYESLAGKNGNKRNAWFFERSIEDLRKILGVDEEKYKLTRDFRIFVIEKPCEEINKANLGVKITPETIKKGNRIVSFRFYCEMVLKKVGGRKKKGSSELPEPTKSPIPDHSLEAKELDHLKKLYPEEYAELYGKILAEPPNAFMRDHRRLWEGHADALACQALRERHGIRQ